MNREKIIEVMVRATHGWAFRILEKYPDFCADDKELARERIDEAQQLARVALTALEAAGFAVVPVEPTDNMVCHQTYTDGEWSRRSYAAMLAAAKEG